MAEPVNVCEIVGRSGDDFHDSRVVSLHADDQGLHLIEQCDQWFEISLSPDEVDRLIAWLQTKRAEMPGAHQNV